MVMLGDRVTRAPVLDTATCRLTFGGPHGARVDAAPVEAMRPPARRERPLTGDLPQLAYRGDAEAAVWSALAAGAAAVRIAGAAGAGATTLLAMLAARAESRGFTGGALRVTGVRGPAIDIGQRLAALVYVDEVPRYRSARELVHDASGVHALALLDRAELSASDQTELIGLFPGVRFVIVDNEPVADTPTVTLGRLDADFALACIEAGYRRAVGGDERNAARELSATVESLPGPARLIGVAAGEANFSFTTLRAQYGNGERSIRALIDGCDPVDRRILATLALARAPLTAAMLADVLGCRDARTALERLCDCELVRRGADTYEIAGTVLRFAPHVADAELVLARLAEVLAEACDPWADEPLPDHQLAAAEPLVQAAFEQSQWDAVLTLGPRLAEVLASRGAFGASGRLLNLVAAAAKRTGAGGALYLARHELGVRSFIIGEHQKAVTLLRSAARDRAAAGDVEGAAASRAVLAYIAGDAAEPIADESRPAAALVARARAVAATSEAAPVARVPRAAPRLTAPVLLAIGATAIMAGVLGSSFHAQRTASAVIAEFVSDAAAVQVGSPAQLCVTATGASAVAISPEVGPVPAEGQHCVFVRPHATTTYVARARGRDGNEVRATVTIAVGPPAAAPGVRIRSFMTRPARVIAGRPAQLCYAVEGAALLRIVPYVGPLLQQRACRPFAAAQPRRYRYELYAVGADGQVAHQQIGVDVAAPVAAPIASSAPQIVAAPARIVASSSAAAPARRAHAPPRWPARAAIYQFDITPAVVNRGQTASLCVGVGRYARGNVTSIGPLPPGITRCYRVRPLATTVYTLRVALDRSVDIEALTLAVQNNGQRRQMVGALRR